MLHPKQLVAFRSKATEILYVGANRLQHAAWVVTGLAANERPQVRSLKPQSCAPAAAVFLPGAQAARAFANFRDRVHRRIAAHLAG
jgi:hypothetical protein